MTLVGERLLGDGIGWVKQRLGYPLTAETSDVRWEGTDYTNDFTLVEPTGSVTVTEQNGNLSVYHPGSQDSLDYSAALKSVSFSTGDEWVCPIRIGALIATTGDQYFAGIMFADGATAASNAVVGGILVNNNNAIGLLHGRDGTITNMANGPFASDRQLYYPKGWAFIKLGYPAANTFQLFYSPDGISWLDFGEADISKTMTPTHVGVTWLNIGSGGSDEMVFSYGPLQKVA